MAFAKENSGLVRAVRAVPSPYLVMATDQQVRDMKRFAQGGVVSIDPTFNLGNFFVTPITYTNTLVVNKRYGNHGVFCGPVLIHYTKTKDAYKSFYQEVNKLVGHDQAITQYGTDGERALIDALEEVYPTAKALRCTKHFLDNAASSLKNEPGSCKFKHELKTLLEQPIELFEDGLNDLISKWPVASKFLSDNELTIKHSLHSANHNGKLFYTNSSESVNAKLKRFAGFKQHGLLEFLKLLQEFFISELGSAHDGYTGMSQTYARSDVSIPGVAQFDWNAMNENERRKTLLTFDTVDLNSLTHNQLQNVSVTDFNITPEACDIMCPVDILRMAFSKADEIITKDHIMKAPSMDKDVRNFSCLSSSEPTKLYSVSIKPIGMANCQCKQYSLYHICSHTIAATHINGTLYDMVRWHRKKFKVKVSNMVLCQSTDTSRSGLKNNQTLRRRKTKNSVKESPRPNPGVECTTDHTTVPRLVYRINHKTVSTCLVCSKSLLDSDICIGEYIMCRSYRDKSTKQLKVSFKKQWAYSHIGCYGQKNTVPRKIHACLPISVEHRVQLESNGIDILDQ